MHLRHSLRFNCIALITAIVSACSGGGAPPPQVDVPKQVDVPRQVDLPRKGEVPKTELLPADGGDLGKAFADLQSAIAVGDKVRVGKLTGTDGEEWDLKMLSDVVKDYKVIGGKRQGDRATLFVREPLNDKGDFYGAINATHTTNGWQFDDASPIDLRPDENDKRDCAATPQKFPCGALSAPDARVSGTASEPKISDEKQILQIPLIDGFAVRMLKHRTKVPVSTRLFLSGTGVNAQLLAQGGNPIGIGSVIRLHLLTLDIAPDGKSAHGEYAAREERGGVEFDVKDGKDGGLNLDASQPNRLRGHVTANLKDAGKLDVTFDVGIASECIDEMCYDADQASEPEKNQ